MKQFELGGMTVSLNGPGPFKARSASDKTDDWPFWFVCQEDDSRVGGLLNILRIEGTVNGRKISGYGSMLTDRMTAEFIAKYANEGATP